MRAAPLLLPLLLAGCAAERDLAPVARYYDSCPRTILVLPPRNLTSSAEGPRLFLATLSQPLVGRGYYVMPPWLVAEILAAEGIDPAGQAWEAEPAMLHRYLGADAVLYVTIKEWDTRYAVLASAVVVTLHMRLVDARTGELLWEREGRRAHESRGGGQGLGGLIAAALDAALTAATVDYIPLAEELNHGLLATLPPGGYHPAYAGIQREIDEWRRERGPASRPAATR